MRCKRTIIIFAIGGSDSLHYVVICLDVTELFIGESNDFFGTFDYLRGKRLAVPFDPKATAVCDPPFFLVWCVSARSITNIDHRMTANA